MLNGGGQPQSRADWSCLRPTLDPLTEPGSLGEPVLYSLRLVNLATQEGLANVQVVACGLADIACDDPIASVGMRFTDDNGLVGIPLWENFNGYLQITSPEVVPYIFHFPETGVRDMPDFPLLMIALANYERFLEVFDLPPTSALGAVAVRTFDCASEPAAGVELELEGEGEAGQRWYFEGSLPNTSRQQTDVSGLGGYIGSATGLRTLLASLPDGTPVVRKRIIVRSGFMTAGYLAPSGDGE